MNPAMVMASRDYQAWAETDQAAPKVARPSFAELLARLTMYQLHAMFDWMSSASNKLGYLRFDSGEMEYGSPEYLAAGGLMRELNELCMDNVEARQIQLDAG